MRARAQGWPLLDIDFHERETFAGLVRGACRILERAKRPAERRELAEAYSTEMRISDERVDPAEVASIVQEAAAARNGWKVILSRCAPTVVLSQRWRR